jgi:hypothetical protein
MCLLQKNDVSDQGRTCSPLPAQLATVDIFLSFTFFHIAALCCFRAEALKAGQAPMNLTLLSGLSYGMLQAELETVFSLSPPGHLPT